MAVMNFSISLAVSGFSQTAVVIKLITVAVEEETSLGRKYKNIHIDG